MKRNIILFSIFFIFLLGSYFQHSLMNSKLDKLLDLKAEQKKVNEKFISADLLSKNLNRVLDLFNENLALTANDSKNDEASMPFLDNLTDLFVSLGVEVIDIKPVSKEKRGSKNTYIPYKLELRCTFQEFANLVNDLEKNDRLIVIDEFRFFSNAQKLSKMKDPESVMNHKVSLVISAVTLNKARG
jgi:Tfp pilus assembly protein PilO